jgi:hypothetical protein
MHFVRILRGCDPLRTALHEDVQSTACIARQATVASFVFTIADSVWFGLSSRTLQRKLAERDMTYRSVLEAARYASGDALP